VGYWSFEIDARLAQSAHPRDAAHTAAQTGRVGASPVHRFLECCWQLWSVLFCRQNEVYSMCIFLKTGVYRYASAHGFDRIERKETERMPYALGSLSAL
jgi:hypothetical protein